MWTRLSLPWALLAAWMSDVPVPVAVVAACAVAPLGAALYALSYVLLRRAVMVSLNRLKVVDTLLLVTSLSLSALAAASVPGMRLWPVLPATALLVQAWYVNWWHQGSQSVPGGDTPEPPLFQYRPVHGPITADYLGYDRSHTGVDIGVPEGTPVVAPGAGRVTHAGPLEQWGYAVLIDHGGGWSSLYAHLEAPGVRRDNLVMAGQVIGWSGTSGISTGPHLHLELRYCGIPVNPRPLINAAKDIR